MAKIYSLKAGARIPEDVLAVASREKIGTALVTAIGGVKGATLAYFDRRTKKYEEHVYSEQMEVTSLIGDITFKDGELFLHAHGTFGRRDMSVIGGHVVTASVWPLLEVVLAPTKNRAARKFDEGTRLYVIRP